MFVNMPAILHAMIKETMKSIMQTINMEAPERWLNRNFQQSRRDLQMKHNDGVARWNQWKPLMGCNMYDAKFWTTGETLK